MDCILAKALDLDCLENNKPTTSTSNYVTICGE